MTGATDLENWVVPGTDRTGHQSHSREATHTPFHLKQCIDNQVTRCAKRKSSSVCTLTQLWSDDGER